MDDDDDHHDRTYLVCRVVEASLLTDKGDSPKHELLAGEETLTGQ